MNAFCLLFADSYENFSLGELTSERTLASVPFGGRYRLVDFALSSLVGAGIRDIGIVARNKSGSLMEHVGWGKDWDLNRKNGGIKFLTPFLANSTSSYLRNQIEDLNCIMKYIKNSLCEYCVLCDSNIVMNIDFKKMMDFHKNKNADITFLIKETRDTEKELEVMLDNDGKLTDAFYHQTFSENKVNIQLNIMIMKKELLISLIEKGITYGWNSIKKNIIALGFSDYKIYGYKPDGYTSVIKNVVGYYKTNLDLLKRDIRMELFFGKNPVLTRIKDSVPTVYGDNAKIINSLIADGASVNGCVEKCIIFRDVVIKKGAVLRNCVITTGGVIGENSMLSGVITDKNVTVGEDRVLAGTDTMPFIIGKGKNV